MAFIDALPAFLTNIWLYGIIFLAVVTLVIFIHEMGHYLAARLVGVRPELFSIGFGRELIGRTDRIGTRWSLRLYPFGGYVRMFGETPESHAPEEIQHAFHAKSVGQRAFITIAGPAMNFLFCLLLLTIVFMTLGRPAPALQAVALGVNGPAYQAGIKLGDEVKAIDGKNMDMFETIKTYVADKIGQSLRVEVKRGDALLNFDVVPTTLHEKDYYGVDTTRGSMLLIFPNYGLEVREIHAVGGVDTRKNPDLVREIILKHLDEDIVVRFGRDHEEDYLIHVHGNLNQALRDPHHADFNTLTLGKRSIETMKAASPLQALREAVELSWNGVNSTFGSIYQVFAGSKLTKEMGGVIKISTMAGDMAGKGIYTFLKFVALLSLSIGLINLLPIPLLDGGHLLFQLAEAIKGSPVSLTTKGYVYGFGLIFLFLAIFIINMNDLLALFKLA